MCPDHARNPLLESVVDAVVAAVVVVLRHGPRGSARRRAEQSRDNGWRGDSGVGWRGAPRGKTTTTTTLNPILPRGAASESLLYLSCGFVFTVVSSSSSVDVVVVVVAVKKQLGPSEEGPQETTFARFSASVPSGFLSASLSSSGCYSISPAATLRARVFFRGSSNMNLSHGDERRGDLWQRLQNEARQKRFFFYEPPATHGTYPTVASF